MKPGPQVITWKKLHRLGRRTPRKLQERCKGLGSLPLEEPRSGSPNLGEGGGEGRLCNYFGSGSLPAWQPDARKETPILRPGKHSWNWFEARHGSQRFGETGSCRIRWVPKGATEHGTARTGARGAIWTVLGPGRGGYTAQSQGCR